MNDSGESQGRVPPILPRKDRAGDRPRWRWWVHLLLLVLYTLVIGLSGEFADAAERGTPALTGSVAGLLTVSAVQLGIFGAVFGLAWLASRADKDDLLLRWRGGFWPIPLGIVYSVAIRLGAGMIIAAIAGVLMATRVISPENLQDFFTANRPNVEAIVDVEALNENPAYYWLSMTLLSFVVAGLREELWRAGVLAGLAHLWPGRFGTRTGQLWAVVVAAVIFGVGHLPQGPVAVVLTAGVGLGLGVIMVLHRSLWPAVIAHGMFNATSFALMPWAFEQMRRLQS